MARQEVNIGIEGNDATGDSIRESFRKVNENFQEIYAIFGVSGTLSFISLGDVGPAEGESYNGLIPNTLPFVNGIGSQINLLELASNSALGGGADDTITFDYSVA